MIAIDGDVNACDLIDDDWQGVNAVVVGCRQDIRAAGGEINCIRLAIRVGGVDRAFQSGDIAIGDVESSCLCFARAQEQQNNSEEGTKNCAPFHFREGRGCDKNASLCWRPRNR